MLFFACKNPQQLLQGSAWEKENEVQASGEGLWGMREGLWSQTTSNTVKVTSLLICARSLWGLVFDLPLTPLVLLVAKDPHMFGVDAKKGIKA